MELPQRPRYFLKSLASGLKTLQVFAEAGSPITVTELARSLGSNNATATRLCYTLSELGLIRRDEQRRYQLTPKFLTLGYSTLCGWEWRNVAKYYLERLSQETQKTVNFAVLEGSEILYLIRIRTMEHFYVDIRLGTKLPVYCTSMGKVLLATSPPKKTKPILSKLTFHPFTAHTITNIDDYLEELKLVKTKGYAISYEELSIGACAIAAPILDENNYAIAAMNISASTREYRREEIEKTFAPHVLRVAQEISKALHGMHI